MRPGLANIIEKVSISRYFGRPETDLHIAENACCVDYDDTRSSKQVHWLSIGQSTNGGTTYYGCENTVEFVIGVAWVSLPITKIHLLGSEKSKLQPLPATPHNTGWMDHSQVGHGSFVAIPILDPVDVEKAYSESALCHHWLVWHVWSYGWHYASFGLKEDTMDARLILCHKGCTPEAVQLLFLNHSNDWSASHFGTYPWSFPDVVIIYEVGHGDGY